VLHIVLNPALAALHAVAGAVLLVDPAGHQLQVVATEGHEADAQTIWQDGPLDGNVPAGAALEQHQALYFGHQGSLVQAYPELEERTGAVAPVATAVLPMFLDDQPLGAIILDFKEPHSFTSEERQFLQTLAAQCALALGRAQVLTSLRQQITENEALTSFSRFAELSAEVTDLSSLIDQVTAILRSTLGEVSVAYYELEQGLWSLQAWSDDLSLAALQQMQPGFAVDTCRFARASQTRQPLFIDGRPAESERLPGDSPSGSTVLYPLLMAHRPLSMFSVGVESKPQWTDRGRGIIRAVGRSLQLALERTYQTRQLQEEQAASQAFVTFTEVASHTSDVQELARLALSMLQDVLPGSSVGFYELEGDRWYARQLTADMGPELQATLRAGLPLDTPAFAEMLRTQAPVFVNQWNEQDNGIDHSAEYGQAAFYPILQRQRVGAALAIGLQAQDTWSDREHQVVVAVGRSFSLLYDRIAITEQLQVQKAEAERRSDVLEAFAVLTAELTTQLDPYELIRRTQEIVLSLLPDSYALYWEPVDGLWQCRAQTGEVGNSDLQRAIDAGIPIGQLPTIDRPWETGKPEYHSQYAVGRDLSAKLTDHIQAVAAVPVFQNETLRGIMNFTTQTPHVWRTVDQVVLETVQQSLSLALDWMHQQRRVQQEQAALHAYVQFTTTVASSTNLEVLAAAAANTVRDVVDGAMAGFYLVREDTAYPVFLSDNTPPQTVASQLAGTSLQFPLILDAVQQRATVFSTPDFAQLYSGVEISALSVRFYFQNDQPYAMFATGTRRPSWTEQERAIIDSVGRGLELALERAASAGQVQRQRDEAESRARALDAFAVLSRDLAGETSRYVLVQRSQQIMLSLLTPGYALYWEQAGDHWTLKSQAGNIGNPELQRLVDEQGLPLDAPALYSTWLTGVPNYQDNYAQGADTPAEMIRHVNAATAFRIEMHGVPIGMLAIGLFDQQTWTPMNKVMLETAIHSLSLVLERAMSVEALEQVNRDLQAANEELEAFTYSASHDLRTPVRHVMGFAELAQKALETTPNEKAQKYLEIIKQGATRMNALIDGMLVLSRSGRQTLGTQLVDLNELVAQARRDVAAEFAGHPVHWLIGELPQILGDRDLLQQVITNLLSNAVKYSAKRAVSEVKVWAEEQTSEWRISVKDNGVGFDAAYAGKLFGIFQRLHTERDFKGTGVGLATVRRIVLKHGGQVFAESPDDSGATFGFTLPKG